MPTAGAVALYLVLPGVLAVGAHRALDGLWPVGGVPRAVLWVAPVGLALVWVVVTALALNPLRIVILPSLALVIWAMVRRAPGTDWPAPVSGAQALLPLLPPVAVALAAPPLWAQLGGVGTNVAFGWITGLCGLGVLIVAVMRRPAVVSPGRG